MLKKYTIRDIAKMAGVSPTTISKIMNKTGSISQETTEKVLKIIKETGYYPTYSAQSLASNKSNLIGIIVDGEYNVDFTHPFFNHVLNSFKNHIGTIGYDFMFFSNEKFTGEYLERCRHYKVDGCLIISGDNKDEGCIQLDQSEIPVVGVDMELSGSNSRYVMTDNRLLAEKVVQHAYLHNISSIGFIGGNQDSYITELRESGFRHAIDRYGLKLKEEWIVYGDFFDRSGYECMKQILDCDEYPELIFAASDLMALGAMAAVKERNLSIPEDIRIVGCDDIEASRFSSPTLSTVKQDKEKIGLLAAYLLSDLIEEKKTARSILVDPILVVRGSG
ncbi:LacI family DNA-binding transcriptional regulator [Gracilibacillus oryzae]|uniref:LacI family DNA-binding transcriptional regulator n=1 Tax=Gracilibacillus oryzae TaxID=1672701 RepID=UPI002B1BD2E3|nr:LacI family DNA-binding transcriptional regulator [Gracilibacillus oryzae]